VGSAAPSGETLAGILAEVRRVEVLGRRLAAGAIAGGYGSAFRGSGIEWDDVREYAEGDDPRAIDGSVTARMGRPFVRRHIEERERNLLFLLDVGESMEGGFGPWSAREVALRIVAGLALAAARHHDRAGLLAFGRSVAARVPLRRGSRHVLRILRDGLVLPPEPGPADVGAALDEAATSTRRHAIVFVLSDFLSAGWEEALARCARRHDVIAVRIRVPETDLPSAGLLRVRDPSSGRESWIDSSSPRVRAAFAAAAAAWRARTDAALRRAGADRIDVAVPRTRDHGAVAGPLARFFALRERRRARR
jgi:uncharacterized protein (DUF58 family)